MPKTRLPGLPKPLMVMTAERPRDAAVLIADVASRLSRGEPDERRREARLLLALALEREAPVLPHEDIIIDAEALLRLDGLIRRRNQGEPVSRLRGWREFFSLPFQLNAATLDPRPDSEVLVETGLALAKDMAEDLAIIDFGTGSGCLLLALLHHLPHARGLGVDLSPDAVAAAENNARHLGLAGRSEFLVSDWDSALPEGQYDLVISNPPYIASGDIDGLEDEVRIHDPQLALDGGADGLDIWRLLLPVMARRLKPHGKGVVEIGYGQAGDVSALGLKSGLQTVSDHPDLAGRTRCLVLAKPD